MDSSLLYFFRVLYTFLLGVTLCISSFIFVDDAKSLTIRSKDMPVVYANEKVFLTKKHLFCIKSSDKLNISPHLEWMNFPVQTKSFAVTMYDPDFPTGSGWWNWIAYDIPSSINELPTGVASKDLRVLPKAMGKHAKNDYGLYGYGGPCPLIGRKDNRYIITVYALAIPKLPLKDDSESAAIRFAIIHHAIDSKSLQVYYKNT